MGDDELDVAVFRFTLGIPGFDDRNIPRVVGLAMAAALAANHLASPSPVPDAQLRAEFLDALLVALCVLVPDIEERLRDVLPGRGKQQGAAVVEGAAQAFALAPGLDDASKKELAWASFVLLRNSNACTVVAAARDGQAVMARGAVGSAAVTAGDAAATLAAVSRDLSAATSGGGASAEVAAVARGKAQQLWLPDRGAISKAGLNRWPCVPAGAQSALLQALPGGAGGLLLLLSERPRGLSDKDRKWGAALAGKLSGSCPALAAPAAAPGGQQGSAAAR